MELMIIEASTFIDYLTEASGASVNDDTTSSEVPIEYAIEGLQ
jgi:hypothetical protein